MRRRPVAIAFALLCLPAMASAAEAKTNANANIDDYGGYVGNYRFPQGHALGIDKLIMDSGETAMLISDYSSGVVRRLFPVSDTELLMGTGFNDASQVELAIRFSKADDGAITGMTLRRADSSERFAKRVALRRQEVSFGGADAKLAGTLIMPASEDPHPAIILLHGSAPLTRYSFGPYPHFFASLGFAVLIYDKRGSGASTAVPGIQYDANGVVMNSSFHPEALANDALAALRYLQGREDIDASQIGFWGSSEGGMLATM